jgi:hypothetical protein
MLPPASLKIALTFVPRSAYTFHALKASLLQGPGIDDDNNRSIQERASDTALRESIESLPDLSDWIREYEEIYAQCEGAVTVK